MKCPTVTFSCSAPSPACFPIIPAAKPSPTRKKKDALVIGDVIVEFDRYTGRIVRQHNMMDILDPYRIGYGSLGGGFYAQAYKGVLEKPGKDWSHTNSIFYDPSDDSAIMSVYHLDFVYKLALDTGKIKWILGNHEDWTKKYHKYLLTPPDDFLWNWSQHAAKLTPNGAILLYDNGTNRARPFQEKIGAKDRFSRAVEFKINEKTMEVEQVWHYGGPDGERFFSSFICDVDWLPTTGNVLITDGGRTRTKDGKDGGSPFGGQHWSRILEVTHTTPSEKVWELTLEDEAPEGWAVYRSDRFASLYP